MSTPHASGEGWRSPSLEGLHALSAVVAVYFCLALVGATFALADRAGTVRALHEGHAVGLVVLCCRWERRLVPYAAAGYDSVQQIGPSNGWFETWMVVSLDEQDRRRAMEDQGRIGTVDAGSGDARRLQRLRVALVVRLAAGRANNVPRSLQLLSAGTRGMYPAGAGETEAASEMAVAVVLEAGYGSAAAGALGPGILQSAG